jgi:hypothetical protein
VDSQHSHGFRAAGTVASAHSRVLCCGQPSAVRAARAVRVGKPARTSNRRTHRAVHTRHPAPPSASCPPTARGSGLRMGPRNPQRPSARCPALRRICRGCCRELVRGPRLPPSQRVKMGLRGPQPQTSTPSPRGLWLPLSQCRRLVFTGHELPPPKGLRPAPMAGHAPSRPLNVLATSAPASCARCTSTRSGLGFRSHG